MTAHAHSADITTTSRLSSCGEASHTVVLVQVTQAGCHITEAVGKAGCTQEEMVGGAPILKKTIQLCGLSEVETCLPHQAQLCAQRGALS
eukprot:CAMPEP_0113911326 /NCGR_PEP_ID=MMETSP0780_2-20120614/28136_1 /TAXON_ID=652834 /ORGANISM="Palpitomonas bilix" /LENGTH=89 /DNA_ID=CAMNT_0000907815 /DNA_START=151 /DNA_END=417 /DNA_ORIENTATION=- /assembly_acc=CAM_ASM_000599